MMVTVHSAMNPRCTSRETSLHRVHAVAGFGASCVGTSAIVMDGTGGSGVRLLQSPSERGVCLSRATQELPRTFGALRASSFSESRAANRTVKDELRSNLICKIQRGDDLFPGILGYEDTVVPQVVNAVLSRHNFILLGLRGQAKTRLIRMLTTLLDESAPYVEGCEIHDNPYRPICRRCRDLLAEAGDETPIGWMRRDDRYVEKLATPDVTIADMIGDIDPIKAARRGQDISNELTVHYGLLPRANRGVFAINELPDLAG